VADTPARLYGPARPTNAAADAYTSPAATITTIGKISVANPTASDVTYTLSVGADAAGTRVLDAIVIPAGTCQVFELGLVLAAAEKVQHFAGTTAVLNVVMDGIQTT
jgi:hypothetical protein